MNPVHGMRRFSLLLMAALVASHARGDALPFSMVVERWKYGSVPSTGTVVGGRVPVPVRLLDVPGKHNAELHWYSPYAVVKDSDLDPSLTDAQGAQNSRQVLALSIPRRPITALPSDTLWVSLTYLLDPVGLDFHRSGLIEFWVNDWRDQTLVRGPGLKLHVDLGAVSEDQMRAPDQPPNSRLDTEDRSPPDALLVPEEDTGVDGVDDSAGDALSSPLDLATANAEDRAGDDYHAPAAGYTEIDPRRWIRSNGTERNLRVWPRPDSEDLDLDNVLDTEESYFEYTIDLSDTSRRYLVSDVYAEFAGKAVPHPPRSDNGWRRYRIPIDDAARVSFGAPDLIRARHVRIWVDGIVSPDGPEDPVTHQKRPILVLAGIARTQDIREVIGSGAPNPFLSSTTFAYRLEARARVRAVVLDLQGREVAVLDDDDRDAGYHAFVWDGRQADGQLAPPGLYFVKARVEAGRERLWRVIRLR